MNAIRIEVLTPFRVFYSGSIREAILELEDGQIGILPGHEPFIAPVRVSALRMRDDEGWKAAAISSGTVECSGDSMRLLTGSAEWPEEIDRARAEASLAAAKKALENALLPFETVRARGELDRSRNRIALLDETRA